MCTLCETLDTPTLSELLIFPFATHTTHKSDQHVCPALIGSILGSRSPSAISLRIVCSAIPPFKFCGSCTSGQLGLQINADLAENGKYLYNSIAQFEDIYPQSGKPAPSKSESQLPFRSLIFPDGEASVCLIFGNIKGHDSFYKR